MEKTEKHIAELVRLYETAVSTLQNDIARFAADGTLPPASRRETRAWCYPELRVHYRGVETRPDYRRSFGRLSDEGTYATTVTRPALFADYLAEQLNLLADDYEIEVSVGPSKQEIPFPYVIDASSGLGGISPQDLARHFPTTELALIGDELADGIKVDSQEDTIPLACSTAFAPTSAWHAWPTTPGPGLKTSSASFYLRTIIAMSMNSLTGQANNWAGTVTSP